MTDKNSNWIQPAERSSTAPVGEPSPVKKPDTSGELKVSGGVPDVSLDKPAPPPTTPPLTASSPATPTAPVPPPTVRPEDALRSLIVDAMSDTMVGGIVRVTLNSIKSTTNVSRSFVRMQLDNGFCVVGCDIKIDDEELIITKTSATQAPPTMPKVTATPTVEEPVTLDKDYFWFDPALREKIAMVLAGSRNLWISGPPGCGKSEMYVRLCEEKSIEPVVMSFTGETSTDDLIGCYELRDGNTVWLDGALGRAMEAGVPLICEEIDAAPPEANLAMQRVLEQRHGKPRKFFNTRNGKEYIGKAGFCILADANTNGGGDLTGMHAGTQPQNAALRNRFLFAQVSYPPKDVEKSIIRTRTGLESGITDQILDIAVAARSAMESGNFFTTIGTRTLIDFGNVYAEFIEDGMDKKKAMRHSLELTMIDAVSSPTDATALKAIIQRAF